MLHQSEQEQTHLSARVVHRVRKTNQVANSPKKVPAAKIQKPMLSPQSTPIRMPTTSCPTSGGNEMIICASNELVIGICPQYSKRRPYEYDDGDQL